MLRGRQLRLWRTLTVVIDPALCVCHHGRTFLAVAMNGMISERGVSWAWGLPRDLETPFVFNKKGGELCDGDAGLMHRPSETDEGV